MKPNVHSALTWLEEKIRKPLLKDTWLDTCVATPVKEMYCSARHQN